MEATIIAASYTKRAERRVVRSSQLYIERTERRIVEATRIAGSYTKRAERRSVRSSQSYSAPSGALWRPQ